MAYYAIKMTDGTVAIMQTVGDVTPEECIAKWPASEQARVVSRVPVDKDSLPKDRTQRSKWAIVNGKVEVKA